MARSLRQRHEARFQALKMQRNEWEGHWRELADFIAPERLRLTHGEGRGKKLQSKIIDGTGTRAWRTLASGLMTGVTSPSRPWFKLSAFEKEMNDFGPVKQKLGSDEQRMRRIFQGSNIYNALQTGYGDLGLFGVECMLLLEDAADIIRAMPLTVGEYWLACNYRGVVDTLYRETQMTVEQVVQRWGKSASQTVQNLYDRGSYDERVTICHAIEPRHDRDASKADKQNKPFASNYWEEGSTGSGMLEESGFEENPILAPRWDVVSTDVYGRSPAMVALPDVKMLQQEQLWKGAAIEAVVRPPMLAPSSMRNAKKSLLPGSITYVDDPTGKAYRPAFEARLDIPSLSNDIKDVRESINSAFYADLFMMISQLDNVRTATEITERREEKLLALGPVLERLQNELLGPLIDRSYAIMERRGMLEEAPAELEGQELKIDYISILAQAQKAVATSGLERVAGFVGNLAGVKPESLDKLDGDQIIDEYADMVGVPPSVIRSDDAVQKIRADRAQQQQRQQQAASMTAMAPAAKQGAEAVKILAETDANQGGSANLLSSLGFA